MDEEIREALKEIAKTLHGVARQIESTRVDMERIHFSQLALRDLEAALGTYLDILVLDRME